MGKICPRFAIGNGLKQVEEVFLAELILLRHGQSLWNEKNIFTGWVDVPLSLKGVSESLEAGAKIAHLPIDLVYTSSLVRAQMTAFLALSLHHSKKVPVLMHTGEGRKEVWAKIFGEKALADTIPVIAAVELNERMYGQLQGRDKGEMAALYGQEQVHLWRRSFDRAPPEGESLEMTAERVLPFFRRTILPEIQAGKKIFISAHGNSLRSLLMEIEGVSPEAILHQEIATGIPLLYRFDGISFQRMKKY